MANAFTQTLETLPPWVIPATAVGLVLLALVSNKSSTGASGGAVISYTPTPADPNLTALAAHETDAKVSALQAVVGLLGTEDVSNIAAARDAQLAGIQADTVNRQTAATLSADLAHTAASAAVAGQSINAQLAAALDQNSTTRNISLAQIAEQSHAADVESSTQTSLAEIQAKSASTVAGIQENTTKAVSKNNTVGSIVGSVVGGIAHLFGF